MSGAQETSQAIEFTQAVTDAFGNALGYSIAEGSGQTAGSTAANQQAQPPLEIQQQAMAAGYGPLTPEAAVRALSVNNSVAAPASIDTRTYAADIDDISVSDAAIGQYEVMPGQTLFHLRAQADTWRVVEGQIEETARIEAQRKTIAQRQIDAAQAVTTQNQREADNRTSWRALERQSLTNSMAVDRAGSPIGTSEPGPYLQYSIGTSRRADPDALARNKEYRLSQLDAVGAHAAQRGDTASLHRNALDYTLTSMLQYGSPTELAVGLFSTIAGPVVSGPLMNAAGRFSPSVLPGYAAANAEFGATVSAAGTFVAQSVNSIGRELGDVTQRVLGDILEPAWAKQYLISPSAVANKSLSNGVTFEGALYRAVPDGGDALDISYSVNANGRYTAPGQGGLYFASNTRTVEAEFVNNGSSLIDRTLHSFPSSSVDNLLDLSSPIQRQQLGISLNDLTRTGGTEAWRYEVTQPLGAFAQKNGYNGIIAPSAQADGSVNLILFGNKGVR